MDITFISEDDILRAVKTLKPSRYSDPDNLPAYILKGCIDIFIKPFHYLINLSISYISFLS